MFVRRQLFVAVAKLRVVALPRSCEYSDVSETVINTTTGVDPECGDNWSHGQITLLIY